MASFLTNKRTGGTAMQQKKYTYLIGEGSQDMRELLGGKGANLSEMARLGLPVPHGFTITTEACNEYLANGGKFPEGMWEQTLSALEITEERTQKKFGDPDNPLLVSCRSGASVSMPGMMDTVLNLGLNEATLRGLITRTNNPRFANDCFERLLNMFRSIVGQELPQDPIEQLRLATEAVFKSWNGKRAIDYRNAAGISHDLGTAASIVAMVFGNMDERSATGVLMTRNGQTGKNEFEGEYLPLAQGEDVVSGTQITKPIAELQTIMPNAYNELARHARILEWHFRDMQDIEFTIEQGKLWMLQTRNGKRTAQAAVRIAADMVEADIITKEEAVLRVEPALIQHLLHPQFDFQAKKDAIKLGNLIGSGLNASPGAAVGQIALDADTAERWAKDEKKKVTLVRPKTDANDIHGMLVSQGILTAKGGTTSHASVVARSVGKPAVVGCAALSLDLEKRQMRLGDRVFDEGDWISTDGATGEIFAGQIPTVLPDIEDPHLEKFLSWADSFSRLEVWANADRPEDAELARKFGAKGIGLCRTEHMFFKEDRIPIFQAMILAKTKEERISHLAELLPLQRSDFEGLFRAMDGLPVVIRLLDPPLHEFLPNYEQLLTEVTELRIRNENPELLRAKEYLLQSVGALRELNPMLGARGVRLLHLMPEIFTMQVQAILQAAVNIQKEGMLVYPKIMIPLTADVKEFDALIPELERVSREIADDRNETSIDYQFGTMIEVPRAAITADQLAKSSQFFSFGTNDLTQMMYGISRDDAETGFLVHYLEHQIFSENPFQTIDEEGVGKMIEMGIQLGRKIRPDLEIGICGEHGGDPKSIAFCHKVGMNYVSCVPYSIPVARLAAAHAALKESLGKK